MSRNYDEDFNAFLVAHLPASDFVPAALAADLVADLRRDDSDLLTGWLDLHAAAILTRSITSRLKGDRSLATRSRPMRDFADASERFGDGDAEALRPFEALCVVNEDNLRRQIGDMTKTDHLFVAQQHVKRSNAALFEAAFHKAIAKRIPAGQVTSDVLSEEEFLQLRESIRTPRPRADKAA